MYLEWLIGLYRIGCIDSISADYPWDFKFFYGDCPNIFYVVHLVAELWKKESGMILENLGIVYRISIGLTGFVQGTEGQRGFQGAAS